MTPRQGTPPDPAAPCPCGSGRAFGRCCGPILGREKPAATAEALMRSRYTAFAVNDMDHLRRTLDSAKRARFNPEAVARWNADVVWTGLTIHARQAGGAGDTAGVVEFTAAFEKVGEPGAIHEISRFRKKGGLWLYVDGREASRAGNAQPTAGPEPGQPGRNAPCPCGSGLKHKRCCGK